MQNSFNITPDDHIKGLEIEGNNNEDNFNYITLSLKSFRSSENEQTFCKEIYSGGGNETEHLDPEQTFRKEAYFGPEYDQTDRNVHLLNLQSQTYAEMDSLTLLPRSPDDGWSLRLLLAHLSKETSADDLEIIKILVAGMDNGNVALSLANASCIMVFDIMEKRKFITKNDLLYLQMIMAVLRKDPLIAMVYKYAQSKTNVLHFDPPLKDMAICDSLEEVSVRGADFRCYTLVQLREFCSRIKEIVAAFIKCQKSTTDCRLLVSCVHCETCDDTMFPFVEKSAETADSIQNEETDVKLKNNISHTVCSDVGAQTNGYQQEFEEKITCLTTQLSEAKQQIQEQSKEINELRAALGYEALEHHDGQETFQTCHTDVKEKSDNIHLNESYLKSMEYQLNSLKKENAVLHLISSSYKRLRAKRTETLEQYNEMLQKYNDAEKVITELKIEKTNTEIQMSILQKNFDEIQEKLKTCIEEENSDIIYLRNELELTTASLLNAQNDKRLHDLTKCLEQLASMSMTVKKVYGNFDPAHEHIPPQQDELFRKAISGKIGRLYPQIYYPIDKR